jgi:pyrroloquinoline-quinone synthase
MTRGDLDRLFADVLRDRRLLTHPFYRRWDAGELTSEELGAYAAQYRYFERTLPGVLEELAPQVPAGEARRAVLANLEDETAVPAPHVELFEAFAAVVGAGDDPAGPATERLVQEYRRQLDNGPAQALAALAAYEVQAPEIAASKSAGLRNRYGLSAAQTRFWDVHSTMDTEHAGWVLDALAIVGAADEVVREAARRTADAWWAFLDERQEAAAGLACS